jgi:hypothetical protein
MSNLEILVAVVGFSTGVILAAVKHYDGGRRR